jgi:hypothetical protein
MPNLVQHVASRVEKLIKERKKKKENLIVSTP